MPESLTGWARRIGLALAALLIVSLAASAQSEPPRRSPLGVGPAPVAAPIAQPAPQSWWGQIVVAQQNFMRGMSQQIRALKTAEPMTAALSLAGLAFLYGALHAAGPGHGKAVISSYVLANRDTARRGIFLSFLAAFFQACSAIIFVGILALVLRSTAADMKTAEAMIERASWVFVIGVGVWLLWRQVRPLLASAPRHAEVGAREHVHVHADGSVCNHDHGHGHGHGHGPQATHVHGPDCGHAHMPTPQELEGPWSWRRALAISLGIGIRPCTGAILLMVFAISQGLLWAGVVATFMMSLGTAITVSLLAVLAVTSRDFALKYSGGRESRLGQRVASAVGVMAALVVIGLGTVGLAYPTPEPMFTTR